MSSIKIETTSKRCDSCGEEAIIEIFEEGYEHESICLCRKHAWELIDKIMNLCHDKK